MLVDGHPDPSSMRTHAMTHWGFCVVGKRRSDFLIILEDLLMYSSREIAPIFHQGITGVRELEKVAVGMGSTLFGRVPIGTLDSRGT